MNKLPVAASVLGLVLLGVAIFIFQNQKSPAPVADAAAPGHVVLYKAATCGCCGSWAEHMQKAGFDVEVHDMSNEDLTAIKNQHGVQSKFWSCHTAIVDGYVVEGHVPAEQVRKMLNEHPDIAGLAVPGMPVGSPGMEVADKSQYQAYDVVAFQKNGSSTVFQHVAAGQ